MSMPEFPAGPDITREQALNMILASIAMEELGLSHIINTEGEKLQYVLGTLKGQGKSCATTCDLLEVNKSITRLLAQVQENQMLLKGKMERVLEASDACRPCVVGPCPSQEKGEIFLRGPSACYVWCEGHRLPWSLVCRSGGLQWNPSFPTELHLCGDHAYQLQLSVELKLPESYEGASLSLETITNNRCRTLITWPLPSGGNPEEILHLTDFFLLPPDCRHCGTRPLILSMKGTPCIMLKHAQLYAAQIC